MNKNILLLTYSYPPSVEIGARRWSKISEALAMNGFIIHIITFSGDKDQVTEKKTGDGKLVIYRLNDPRPVQFHIPPNGLMQRIKRKLFFYYLKRKVKGTLYDKGNLLEKTVKLKCEELITEYKIKNIISTGAPFSFLRYATELKIKFSSLNVICDLRDPWTNGHYYGFSSLNEKRKKKEEFYEKYVMTNADHVLCPAPVMTNYLIRKYADDNSIEKFKTLFHPFDRKEFGNPTDKAVISDKITLFTGGTIDLNNIEQVFEPFLQTFRILKKNSPEVFSKTEVIIHSSTKKLIPLLGKEKNEVVKFKAKLPADEFFKEASKASFLLVFLPDDVKDFFITKFTEFLALKKPVIIISSKGEVAEFVEKNRLGLFFNYTDSNAPDLLADAICEMADGKFEFNKTFDENVFSVETAAGKLISYFK